MQCPHCGKEIIMKSAKSGGEEVIELYYRSRAAGSRVTLIELARQTGYNHTYLSQVKSAYDAAGKWGSKGSVTTAPARRGHYKKAKP